LSRRKKPRSFWLFLEPDVFVSAKQNHALLYHTLTGKALEYQDRPQIVRIVRRLRSKKNLLVIRVTDQYLQDYPDISRFVRHVRNYFMGDLLDTALSRNKPIQIMPLLSIQQDAVKLKKDPSRSVGEGIMTHLIEISFYISGSGEPVSPLLPDAYRQFPFSRTGKDKAPELSFESIKKLLEETRGSSLRRLNILGGNILQYSSLDKLTDLLNPFPTRKVFYFHYLHFKDNNGDLQVFQRPDCGMNAAITFPAESGQLTLTLKRIKEILPDTRWTFVVQNSREMAESLKIIDTFKLENVSLQPYYNGKNLLFFKKNVFVNKMVLLNSRPSLDEILARQAINPAHFGRLVVLENGSIHANVNTPRLGRLGKDSLYDILYREMSRGKTWRRVRPNVDPCRRCVFQLLCPPLSNYEYVMGRNNLCTIWKGK
jgi:pseudo-rSAM protein